MCRLRSERNGAVPVGLGLGQFDSDCDGQAMGAKRYSGVLSIPRGFRYGACEGKGGRFLDVGPAIGSSVAIHSWLVQRLAGALGWLFRLEL